MKKNQSNLLAAASLILVITYAVYQTRENRVILETKTQRLIELESRLKIIHESFNSRLTNLEATDPIQRQEARDWVSKLQYDNPNISIPPIPALPPQE